MPRKAIFLVLIAAAALFVGAAQAQVTYQITSTPTFVINTGRAEVLGSVRLTATNVGPTIASTIQVLYQGTACDNTATSGIQVVAGNPAGVIPGGAFSAAGPPAAVSGVTVTNTSVGCIVQFTVQGGINPVVGDFIEIRGVRGRVDFLGGLTNVGTNVLASLNATPSNSSLFTAPTTVVVATTAVGLNVGPIAAVTRLNCVGGGNPSITVQEGFNAAFVQHVATVAGTVIPLNVRPLFGATNNTQVRIEIQSLPSGVTLAWPATVQSALAGGVFTAGVSGSQLELLAGSTSTVATYEYACGDQGQCDLTQESFTITPVATVAAAAAFGTGTIQARLYPPLLATGEATSITSAPIATSPANSRPRFNDPFRPDPAAAFITTAPCATNILFTFVANVAGFDTGLAIANTSRDIFGATLGAINQAGTCVLTGFPADGSASVSFTTPSVAAGATYTTVLSSSANAVFNGFTGYIIARCNFQFAHGYAFITDGFGGGAANRAQGYLALIIPDPVVTGVRRNARPPRDIPETGEGLSQ